MKKLFIPVIALFVFAPAFVKAQLVFDLNDFYKNVGGINIYLDKTQADKEIKIMGSPYAQEDFTIGSVVQHDSITYKNIPLRYNVYEDQIAFKRQNDVVFHLNTPNKFKEINIGKQRYIYGEFLNGKREVKGYYELLVDGKISLLKKKSAGIKEAEPIKAYQDAKPAKFFMKPDKFFLAKENKSIFEINSSKDLLKTLSNHNEKISSYIKSNKLKFKSKKEQDFIKIIFYYNSINK